MRRYVYQAIDQFGQVIDVFVSTRRDAKAGRRFFEQAIGMTKATPVEVVTDQAAAYPAVLDELVPAAWHRSEQYANNRVEADQAVSRRDCDQCVGREHVRLPWCPVCRCDRRAGVLLGRLFGTGWREEG